MLGLELLLRVPILVHQHAPENGAAFAIDRCLVRFAIKERQSPAEFPEQTGLQGWQLRHLRLPHRVEALGH